MWKYRALTGMAGLLAFMPLAKTGDIVSGRSEVTSILTVRSYASQTDFLLASSLAGCGTPDSPAYWKLALDSTDASRFKRAALYGAYLAGKCVQLRCEGSQVTDFHVTD